MCIVYIQHISWFLPTVLLVKLQSSRLQKASEILWNSASWPVWNALTVLSPGRSERFTLVIVPGPDSWLISMGDLQDPTDGGTLVPYVWPYVVGIFPEIKAWKIGLTYGRYLQLRFLKWPLLYWLAECITTQHEKLKMDQFTCGQPLDWSPYLRLFSAKWDNH